MPRTLLRLATAAALALTTAATPVLTADAAPNPADPAQAEVLDLLANMRDNGYNPAVNGMAINWRYGTDPLQINFNGTGQPDDDPSARHDQQVDLRYLEDLLHYRAQHSDDHQFDDDIARYTPIVQDELTQGVNPRGWVYFDLLQLAAFTGDSFYTQQIDRYAAKYRTMADDPQREDWNIERGAALMVHGRADGDTSEVDLGQSRIQAALDRAYDPNLHVLIVRGIVRAGESSQAAEALAYAGNTDTARALLDGTTALLWDPTYGGYYAKADLTLGGTPTVYTNKKESGRQAEMLLAAHLAGDTTLETSFLPVVTGGAYYQPGHGVLYETNADWTPVVLKNDAGIEDWVTSEAMDVNAKALLTLADPTGNAAAREPK